MIFVFFSGLLSMTICGSIHVAATGIISLFFCNRLIIKINIQKTKIMASGPITSWQVDGEQWKQCKILLFWVPKELQMVIAAMKLKDACSLEGKL